MVDSGEYPLLTSDTLPLESTILTAPEPIQYNDNVIPPTLIPEEEAEALPLDNVFEYEEMAQDPFQEKLSSLKKGIIGENVNSVGFGMLYKNRSGASGMDGGNLIVLPALDFDVYQNFSHHFYGHLNFVSLYNGELSEDISSLYGLGYGGNVQGINSLVEPLVGYKYNSSTWGIQAEIGLTPQPAPTESNTVFKLKYSFKGEKVSGNVAFVQESIKDTILSRVGDSFNYYIDENTTGLASRGGVAKQGFVLGMKYSNPDEVVAGNLSYYYDISGTNIYSNEELALTLLYVKQFQIPNFNFFMLGPIFIYDNYNYNSNYFTVGVNNSTGQVLGNGGYFSPNNFILVGGYLDMAQILTPKLLWRVKGNLGLINFTNGRDLFGDTASADISGVGYDIKGFIGYRFEPEFQVLGELGMAASGAYKTFFFGASGIYYFGGKEKANTLDLERSNIIEEFVQ